MCIIIALLLTPCNQYFKMNILHTSVSQSNQLTSFFTSAHFHNVYSDEVDKPTIYILTYTDEFETVNPIGTAKRVHKLFAVYFTILNVPAWHRSQLKHIHLCLLSKD